jgi:hypothetical protein
MLLFLSDHLLTTFFYLFILKGNEYFYNKEYEKAIGKHFDVLEQHIIKEHFHGTADNALVKWLIALNKDVDKTMKYLGYKMRSQKITF